MQSDDDQKELTIKYLEAKRLQCMLRYFSKLGHDSNNQLSTISAGLQLSKTRFQPTDPVYKILEKSLESNNKVASTFKEYQRFRELSKAKKTTFALVSLCQQAVELCDYIYKGSSDNIQFNKNDQITVHADYDLLLLGMFQILLNAIESTSNSENIILDYKTDKNESGEIIVMSITDKGKGIPEKIMNNLYKPFNTTKTVTSAGLGLFTANYALIEHDGSLNLTTNENGTTAELHLPH